MINRLTGDVVPLDTVNIVISAAVCCHPAVYHPSEAASHEPAAMIEAAQRDRLATEGIATALQSLDERSRRIVSERWLNVRDDGSGGMTLHELAAEYGVSAERIRQIEVAAMKKMRKALAGYA